MSVDKPYKAAITIHLNADSPDLAPELLKQALTALSTGSHHCDGRLLKGNATFVVDVVENQSSDSNEFQQAILEAMKQFEHQE